jgi:staphylococcal nuclease domain-containing protein 1
MAAIVEQISNGSTVKARLLLSPTQHQIVTVQLAGIRAPRASSSNASDTSQAEEFGNEARFFVEARLLQRNVKVTLLALPPNAAPASPYIGIVAHPAGNISSLLLSSGLAKCVDLHAGFLGSERMAALRKAESDAKSARRGVWQNVVSNGSSSGSKGKGYEALVTRIYGVDAIGVRLGKDGEGEERKITFSSVRQPKPTDPKLAGLQLEGKEALRKRIIGKTVTVAQDYVKPAEGQFEEKICATVKTANGKNIAEELVEKGYLNVIKHRRDDEDKSSEIDKLIQAEQKFVFRSSCSSVLDSFVAEPKLRRKVFTRARTTLKVVLAMLLNQQSRPTRSWLPSNALVASLLLLTLSLLLPVSKCVTASLLL